MNFSNGDDYNYQDIQEDIRRVMTSFFDYPWKSKDFLTEDDLRCRLYQKLQMIVRGRRDASVHSEVRWYGDRGIENGKLKYRSDIVIICNSDLRDVELSGFKLPSKGYGFNKYYCIIEIKLRRTNDKNTDNAYDDIVNKDVRKLNEIKERASGDGINSKSYYAIVFDKRRKRKKLVANSENNEWNSNTEWEAWNI